MKEFFPVLHTAALFSGISDDELAAMLSCLGARIDTFPKGSRLLRAGESVEEVGRAGADLRGGVRLRAGGGAECERGGGERGDGDVSAYKARFERVPLCLLPP